MQQQYRDIVDRQMVPADGMNPASIGVDAGSAPSGGSAQTDGATVNGF
jgi:hypothetical protein